jgi:hypothetical protein
LSIANTVANTAAISEPYAHYTSHFVLSHDFSGHVLLF